MTRPLCLLVCAGLALAGASAASASQLIDRNATDVQLLISRDGKALLNYRVGGRQRHVLAWGAIDARRPNATSPQVRFRLDYSGGWGAFHRAVWKSFRNVCGGYSGPGLTWFAGGCTAPDGSYWAVQSWQRALPDLGFEPWLPTQSVWELRLSHWRGPLARLEVWTDWVYGGRFQEVFGRLSYRGVAVHGFRTTSTGVPLDSYGRNLYLDTFDSVYGHGWRRENSFVAHKPTGIFCYGFYPFKPALGYPSPPGYPPQQARGPGVGRRYRITVIGPGVTPDVTWEGDGLHAYNGRDPGDVAYERRQNSVLDSLSRGGGGCKQH